MCRYGGYSTLHDTTNHKGSRVVEVSLSPLSSSSSSSSSSTKNLPSKKVSKSVAKSIANANGDDAEADYQLSIKTWIRLETGVILEESLLDL